MSSGVKLVYEDPHAPNEVTLLYPASQRSKKPVVQTQLSKMNDRQKKLASVLDLDRFLHN
jgi:hypothetical protein